MELLKNPAEIKKVKKEMKDVHSLILSLEGKLKVFEDSEDLVKIIKDQIGDLWFKYDLLDFKVKLQPKGLKVKEMESDGNCLFRAIADNLDGDADLFGYYRQEAVDYIREHPDDYVAFIEDDETVDEYCDRMEQDGKWGDQLEMNALAARFKFNIMVHQVDYPSTPQIFHEPSKNFPMVHISYHLGCHYNSIRRLDDTCEDDVIPIENKYAIGIDLKQVPKLIRTLDYE